MSEKRKATIYDWVRYCEYLKQSPCNLTCATACNGKSFPDNLDDINKKVLKWCNEHPVKTRLTEFKKLFPNVQLREDGYPKVCVADIVYNLEEIDGMCVECYTCCHDFWDEEIDD